MKKFNSATNERKTSRAMHVLPILTAYTYAKDCLRKIAKSDTELTQFKDTTNKLLETVAGLQPDIINATVFGGINIEDTIRKGQTPEHNYLKKILDTPYYTPIHWNTIHTGRSFEHTYDFNGYNSNTFRSIQDKIDTYKYMKHGPISGGARRRTRRIRHT